MKVSNELSFAGFEGFENLSMEELALIDGGGFFEGLGYVVGYVGGAVSEIVGGIADACRDINKK